MQAVISVMMLWSVLIPSKQWIAAGKPIEISAKNPTPISLVLTDVSGSSIAPTRPILLSDGEKIDLRTVYPSLEKAGLFFLFAVPSPEGNAKEPAGNKQNAFVGTPLVIGVREDRRIGAPPGSMVVRIMPLQFVEMSFTTEKSGDIGTITMALFYDSAPVTVENFLKLTGEGFYNDLNIHAILPGFTLQGGDPRGDGTGGPGYAIEAEFNNRKHEAGVISMSRMRDPLENASTGVGPRQEFANSAGSQFFICFDYNNTKQYDRNYTAFGRVIDGMKVIETIARIPLADPKQGKPQTAVIIKSAVVKNVDNEHNPYQDIIRLGKSAPKN